MESQAINKPPFFDGSNFSYWKCRMRVFLQSLNFKLWKIVENEFDISTQNEKDLELNAKALNYFYCALSKNEFSRIQNCLTAHELWRTLEITHEGTSKVMETKLWILKQDFELFSMDTWRTFMPCIHALMIW